MDSQSPVSGSDNESRYSRKLKIRTMINISRAHCNTGSCFSLPIENNCVSKPEKLFFVSHSLHASLSVPGIKFLLHLQCLHLRNFYTLQIVSLPWPSLPRLSCL